MIFFVVTDNYWTVEQHRRAFFEDFAVARVFDPLIADNWYLVSAEEILAQKVRKCKRLQV